MHPQELRVSGGLFPPANRPAPGLSVLLHPPVVYCRLGVSP